MALNQVRITAPLSGRLVIRAPYLADMRVRLARCGGVPQWEAELEIWTMPRSALQLVVPEVLTAFDRAQIAIEVKGDVSSTWLTYEACHGHNESLIDWLLGGELTETERR